MTTDMLPLSGTFPHVACQSLRYLHISHGDHDLERAPSRRIDPRIIVLKHAIPSRLPLEVLEARYPLSE
jgi:hypothetical protein